MHNYDSLDYDGSRLEFADASGRSALRAGKRIHPCPTCKAKNRLTAKDKQLGYQLAGTARHSTGPGNRLSNEAHISR